MHDRLSGKGNPVYEFADASPGNSRAVAVFATAGAGMGGRVLAGSADGGRGERVGRTVFVRYNDLAAKKLGVNFKASLQWN